MELSRYLKPLTTLATTIAIGINSATAGLIIDNQEFLDIGLTQNKNIAEIQLMIAGNTALSGFALATEVDMAMIQSLLPYTTYGGDGWNTITSPLTTTQQSILDWYQTGYSVRYDSEYTGYGNGGDYTYNEYQYGTMRYIDSITSDASSGLYDFNGYNGQTVAIFNRNNDDSSVNDLTNIQTSGRVNFSSASNNLHSLFVRTVNVSEPKTLIILFLIVVGCIARNKNKSNQSFQSNTSES